MALPSPDHGTGGTQDPHGEAAPWLNSPGGVEKAFRTGGVLYLANKRKFISSISSPQHYVQKHARSS